MSDDDLALWLFLATFPVQHGRKPRVGEIAAARGLSRQQAKQGLRRLRALGCLSAVYGPGRRQWDGLREVS